MPAYNERFGATAAGSADMKGSAGMPPLRQAAIPLSARQHVTLYRKFSSNIKNFASLRNLIYLCGVNF